MKAIRAALGTAQRCELQAQAELVNEHFEADFNAAWASAVGCKHPLKYMPLGSVLAVLLMLGGCSVPGGGDDFPDPDDTYLEAGTRESSRSITTIHAGMTKDQVRDLLGNPHFSEGLFNVRTWNYLFDLGAEGGHEPMECQFKLTFDGAMRVEETQWRTARCAVRFSAIQAEAIESRGPVQHYRLPIDGVFTSDGDLTDEGRRLLDELADILARDFRDPSLSLASYPDPDRYRTQRQAVRRFLLAQDGASAEDVTLTSASTSPCREGDGVERCRRMEQIVIEIRDQNGEV